MLSSAQTQPFRRAISSRLPHNARLNQSQHHDLLLIENKYTENKAIRVQNGKLKSHFCHTKGNRLKLNKASEAEKLNFLFSQP